MKRLNNLYQEIISIDNLKVAELKARKGKSGQYGIKVFDLDPEKNLELLHYLLKNREYKTSEYTSFLVYEPKEREVFRLPYYPDRITHHAVMNVLERIFTNMFTADSYSCIKGKGIHAAQYALTEALTNTGATKYCLKLDIKKFYPNVDHNILKCLLRRKFKDNDLLWLLDEIIDSAPGIPIGNYLSQYFANFYLTYFDHWIKEEKRVKFYFRYADDIVVLSDSKEYLHSLLYEIRIYMLQKIKLEVKGNYQVFPVASRGIDFVGYKSYHTHVLLRKSIKKRFARMLKKNNNPASINSYYGWAIHCDSKNLLTKLLNDQNHNQLQRLRDKSRRKLFCGFQTKAVRNIKPPDYRHQIRNKAVKDGR